MTCKKIGRLLFHALVPAVLAAFMVPVAVYGEEPCRVNIPVTVQVTGTGVPEGQSYKVKLEGITPQAPMPENSEITLTGAGEVSFGGIEYNTPGDYQYEIRQSSEAAEYFVYDESVYQITVRVVWDESGRLTSMILAHNEAAGAAEKVEGLTFTNQYTRIPGGGTPSGGGGGGGPRGDGGSSSNGGPGVVGDGLTQIGDETTPLADFPGMISEMIPETILDSVVPLAMLPQTGDTTSLGLWILLMAVSGCGLMGLLAVRRRIV